MTINYDSFTEVIEAATLTAHSISLMVGGVEVRATNEHMRVADDLNQFHAAVKAEYERQKSEANKEARTSEVHASNTGGTNSGTDQYRGGATSTENNYERGEEGLGLTELLTSRYNRVAEVLERLKFEQSVLKADLEEAEDEYKRIKAALSAIQE